MVAFRFEGESCGMSENEWVPLPDSGRRSKIWQGIRPGKRIEVHQGSVVQESGVDIDICKMKMKISYLWWIIRVRFHHCRKCEKTKEVNQKTREWM